MKLASKVIIKAVLVLTMCFLITQESVAAISSTINFDAPEITLKGEHSSVTIENGLNLVEGGNPSLPSVGNWIILPPGEKAVSCYIENEKWNVIPGKYIVEPAGYPQRISSRNNPEIVPNTDIYNSSVVFPQSVFSGLKSHQKRGVSVATVLIWPVRWSPDIGKLEYLESAELIIETSNDIQFGDSFSRFYRGDSQTLQSVSARSINPRAIFDYPHRDELVEEGLMIICDDEFEDCVENYSNWHRSRGVMTIMATTSQLLDEFDGDDDQEKIRNGIIDAYEEFNIGFVLLIGDDDQIPHRGLYGTVNNDPDLDIPADLYYGSLDGNWNDDGDEYWGEYSEADFLAEVYVGRFAAGDEEEILTCMNKNILYSDEPVIDDVLNVLMVGEELGWANMGGDYMDEVFESCGRYGYETSGFPDRFERTNVYDRDREWNAVNDLAPEISEGAHFVNHLGHANTRYGMKFNANQLNDRIIENNGEEAGFSIGFTQGCYSGAFDNRTTEVGNYTADCITEHFVSKLDNGFVAFLANSRYGWGSGGNTNGASQHFHREFIDAIFDEDITEIGKSVMDCKEDTTPWLENSTVMRWCFYEYNLFGDPSMDIWTDTPAEIEAEFREIIMIGETSFDVSLDGVENARVSLTLENEILASGLTDENGDVTLTLDSPIVDDGEVTLTIIAHNYLPFTIEIESASPENGYPWVDNLEIEDIGWMEDGQADPGETIDICPVIRNLGQEELRDVEINLTSEDQFVTIDRSMLEIELLTPDCEFVTENSLSIELSEHTPDLHEAHLTFTILSDGEEWEQDVILVTHAAIIEAKDIVIIDREGNNNGRLDPGETASVYFSIMNSGTGRELDLSAEFLPGSEFLDISVSEALIEFIEPLEEAPADRNFEVTLSEDCPNPYRAVFYFKLENERGFCKNILKDVKLGGQFHTFENNAEMLDHEAIGEDNFDQWHVSDNDNRTPVGDNCLKAGNRNQNAEYRGMLNSAVYLEPFTVDGPVQLRFWHKIDAEISNNHEGYAYDGGFVEASSDGDEWTTIEPTHADNELAYPYLIRHGGSPNPLPEDQPCFSGVTDWEEVSIDLSEFDGSDIEIRFRFGSDSLTHGLGWFIDDIELFMPMDCEPPDNLEGNLTESGAELIWETPYILRDDGDINNQLIGYRIYRETEDWTALDTTLYLNSYFDALDGVASNTIMYMVTALYENGESLPSNILTLEWENAVNDLKPDLPLSWDLSTGFPNPFNSFTLVNYTVPVRSDVQVGLYNILGQEITLLKTGIHEAGKYGISINADNLSSGIYIVKLENQQRMIATRRIVLIK